jgi:hypothetical protein
LFLPQAVGRPTDFKINGQGYYYEVAIEEANLPNVQQVQGSIGGA